MEPDRPEPLDLVERAHLVDPADRSHTVHRYGAPDDLADLVRRFWLPVWSVPPGEEAVQRVLQYPVALVVVASTYTTVRGPASGLSEVALAGDGWAAGVMFQPAAGAMLVGGTMDAWTDRAEPLEVLGPHTVPVVTAVREAMGAEPHAEASHRRAIEALAGLARRLGPVDAEGRLANEVVACVEDRPEITSVALLCAEVGLGERALQRLTRARLGLTPRWLIQRRRLHEAAERLRTHGGSLADLAAELGYADQPHFTRDLRTVTDMTPGQLAALHRP
ncbi:helix-turn-helix domain-containing protein [Iamia majanohamensis]|uniref:Helix-turn-helix domain-containing protein n=1 Tax=Iamia majanohamensis TaxID=467976 RepID=A0AAF0BWN0_9ACTN|nr:helix-turn-helix domain-containing protein [Iamia majanohamensis]WCO67629.1 helix-turn-helix domain-containing protein [Iamia majanohamensis]